jgi:hypothetical protein
MNYSPGSIVLWYTGMLNVGKLKFKIVQKEALRPKIQDFPVKQADGHSIKIETSWSFTILVYHHIAYRLLPKLVLLLQRENGMDELLRKTVTVTEEIFIEGGKKVAEPYTVVTAAAILTNPWAGRAFVDDLSSEINSIAPKIGEVLVPILMEAIGGADKVEAYGKAAVVGLNGEIEHASALIHTLLFGNQLRQAVAGAAYLSFTNKRASAGCSVDIPLKHINEEGRRSHFMTATITIADAPALDEIVVALAVASSGRPHHRIGDRYEDMKAMGVDQTGQSLAKT